MRLVSLRHAALAGFASLSIGIMPLPAQTANGGVAPVLTRAQLAERARQADSLGRHEEAFVLRSRLNEGDFAVGDAVIIQYEGAVFGPTASRRDSLIVQAGKMLLLGPPMGDLGLTGVLRFELEDSVRARLNKYYREQSVRVTPLIRLSISGGARNTGFFQFRSDALFSDVTARAGGSVTPGAVDEITIKRGDKVIWGAADVQTALSGGMTISGLDLQPGDDIVFAPAKSNIWKSIWPYTTSAVTLLLLLLRRR
jgi:hypothetical protein